MQCSAAIQPAAPAMTAIVTATVMVRMVPAPQDQGTRADALLVQANEAGAKGDLIIYNLELVDQLLAALNSQLASGAAGTRSMHMNK